MTERLPWLAVLVALATAVVLLFGPLWSTAEGENPLERASGVDYGAVLRLGLPTVIVLASLGVALAGRPHRWFGALALLVLGYAVVVAPSPVGLSFAPAALLTLLGYAVTVTGRDRPVGQGV